MAAKRTEQTPVQESYTEAVSVKESESSVEEEQTARFENAVEEYSEGAEERSWIVKITNNSDYCGVGAGGIQFANGQALIRSARMAAWFKEHKGYKVIEQ